MSRGRWSESAVDQVTPVPLLPWHSGSGGQERSSLRALPLSIDVEVDQEFQVVHELLSSLIRPGVVDRGP